MLAKHYLVSDPISQLEEKQQLISHQRAEHAEIENEIDTENAEELKELRGEIMVKTKEELVQEKQSIVERLKQNGEFTEKGIMSECVVVVLQREFSRVRVNLLLFRSFCNFVHPTLHVSFRRDNKKLLVPLTWHMCQGN